MKEYISPLRKSSLKKVFDWCEENPTEPLALLYLESCSGIGARDSFYKYAIDAFKKIYGKKFFNKKLYKQIERLSVEINGIAFDLRDSIGRVILAQIKADEKLNRAEPTE